MSVASDCASDLFHLYSVPELLNIGGTELPHSSCELLESAAIQAAAERLVRYRRMECQENLGTEQSYYGHLDSCGYLQEATEVLCSLADNNSFLSQIIPQKNSRILARLKVLGKECHACLCMCLCMWTYAACMHACMQACMHACMSFSVGVCVCGIQVCVCACVCVCVRLRACMHMRTYVCILWYDM